MNCPYCGKEMEKGYLQSRDGLGWSRKERSIAAFSGFFCEVPLGRSVISHHCKDCGKIVISYEPLPPEK